MRTWGPSWWSHDRWTTDHSEGVRDLAGSRIRKKLCCSCQSTVLLLSWHRPRTEMRKVQNLLRPCFLEIQNFCQLWVVCHWKHLQFKCWMNNLFNVSKIPISFQLEKFKRDKFSAASIKFPRPVATRPHLLSCLDQDQFWLLNWRRRRDHYNF